ncbi:23S rRNA (adenine(1618)-N(6))-methyltransferase RlmF [Dokdonia sinensis]|uniref:23S rRNA (Adenine(1618)-N(6))-methyltransferase RlmF n=1 Tax=Dokdonia sinensis TaxID=2479847 RepID=A0A3M0GD52_9FLAO|nr:23S rRNA (adenine(1618)-N(6))-methyltransferase RlmF [Dokdonia sinensis]RMB59503.1 23S rRNA (adenine(1618)-N(6))-methyltransferase RlmF [Dokdonia sinensis]
MHDNNIHKENYNFKTLVKSVPELQPHLKSITGKTTIDFNDASAVFLLNKALLLSHYDIRDWSIPENYLCPPIPGRVDYIHHLKDLINKNDVKGLDIGTGASLIYPLLSASVYDWEMTGVEVDETAFKKAKENLSHNPHLASKINIIHQKDRGNIFKGAIAEEEFYEFTMCNPPFYASEEDAVKANRIKNQNLKARNLTRNFAGVSTELWCNGGEALFIKRMIKESVDFKTQVGWFTTLVSRSEHLPKIYKQLDKLKATHKTVAMELGNKKTRFVGWRF